MAPIERNGQEIDEIALNGNTIDEVTVNGQTVFTTTPPPGTFYYIVDSAGFVEFYTLPSPFDIANRGSPTSTFSRAERVDNIAVSNDGSVVYIDGSKGDSTERLDLNTPFDIGDISQRTQESLPIAGASERTCLDFADQGNRLYQNSGDGEIVQYNLSTPYDITTAGGITGSISADAAEGPGDPAFSPDGLKMAFGIRNGDTVTSGSLSTPFDISTFTEEDTFSTTNGDPSCLKWNDDGTEAYIRHASPDMVNEFSTSVPYSTQTMSFTQELIPTEEYGFAAGGHEFNKAH